MEIVIERFRRRYDSLDGWLKVNGEKLCDTAESPRNALAEGTYRIDMTKCKQHGKRVLRLVPVAPLEEAPCGRCRQLAMVSANTRMPVVCPMITMGNGVRGRADGSIIIGERVAYGSMIRSAAAYDKLYERVKKAVQRGAEVEVRIQ